MPRVYLGEDTENLHDEQLAVGQETMSRTLVNVSNAVTLTDQSLRLMYFTARKTETVTQARVMGGGTSAGATPTLIRWGLWRIGANAAGVALAEIIASTPNDTALFNGGGTSYTKAFSASAQLQEGTRYAFGILVVTGATAPNVCGMAAGSGATNAGNEWALAPRITGRLDSQADLPTSFLESALGQLAGRFYAVLLP